MNEKIGILSTLNQNIGDDLIRDGIIGLIRSSDRLRNQSNSFVIINKHRPLSAYPAFHPARIGDWFEHLPRFNAPIRKLFDGVFSPLGSSKFDKCKFLVQSGAPVFWDGCGNCDWATPVWRHIFARLVQEGKPLLNLAAGSCYRLDDPPTTFEKPSDRSFADQILKMATVTTVRDNLAFDLCASIGHSPELLPCTAFVAAQGDLPAVRPDGFLLVNFMEIGGHYTFGQEIDGNVWKREFTTLLSRLRKHHKIAFLCHDAKERSLAEELTEGEPVMLPRSSSELLEICKQAKAGICNRMHAAVALASLGRPAIAICSDTRLFMPELIGIPCFNVVDASADVVEAAIETEIDRPSDNRDRLFDLRENTRRRYIEIIEKAVWA